MEALGIEGPSFLSSDVEPPEGRLILVQEGGVVDGAIENLGSGLSSAGDDLNLGSWNGFSILESNDERIVEVLGSIEA